MAVKVKEASVGTTRPHSRLHNQASLTPHNAMYAQVPAMCIGGRRTKSGTRIIIGRDS
jgi:hypothetical protein